MKFECIKPIGDRWLTPHEARELEETGFIVGMPVEYGITKDRYFIRAKHHIEEDRKNG